MILAQATVSIVVPWWTYLALAAVVFGLLAVGYVAGRADRRDALDLSPVDDRLRFGRRGRHAAGWRKVQPADPEPNAAAVGRAPVGPRSKAARP